MADIPQPNTQAIDFELLSGDNKLVKLSDYRGKNVVLVFYPADWSPVCTNELALMQETLEDIHNYNAEVLGISVDSHWCHRAWAENMHITFPLLSDFWPHGKVSQQYGVFYADTGYSRRSVFFVDASGILRASWVAPNQDVAPSLNIIFNALKQMQGAPERQASHA